MGKLPDLLPRDGAATRRALLLALAALLSFAAASLLHVHNAYWAAMPVWVIAQPARGVLLERAVFRIVGTLAGAAVGFLLIHAPPDPQARRRACPGFGSADLRHARRRVKRLASGRTAGENQS